MALAESLNGEIISVDSMQVYRGMDIGTAKPSSADREKIPHHLIDVVDLDQNFDAAAFVRLANEAEKQILSRGRVPIYCGGTGLYFNALLQGLGEAPPSNPKIRAELETTPLPHLLDELQKRDSITWEKIDRQNPRRVIRALEVIRITNRPFSAQRSEWVGRGVQPAPPKNLFALEMSQPDLHQRINARVDLMFKGGLVEETRSLVEAGLRENRTACQALGYKQVIDHLDGAVALPQTIDMVKLRTRQFAKRQLTWFRRQLPCQWISLASARPIPEIRDHILKVIAP